VITISVTNASGGSTGLQAGKKTPVERDCEEGVASAGFALAINGNVKCHFDVISHRYISMCEC
jgi:hypothetical protein